VLPICLQIVLFGVRDLMFFACLVCQIVILHSLPKINSRFRKIKQCLQYISNKNEFICIYFEPRYAFGLLKLNTKIYTCNSTSYCTFCLKIVITRHNFINFFRTYDIDGLHIINADSVMYFCEGFSDGHNKNNLHIKNSDIPFNTYMYYLYVFKYHND
jgi:hypothetical protein